MSHAHTTKPGGAEQLHQYEHDFAKPSYRCAASGAARAIMGGVAAARIACQGRGDARVAPGKAGALGEAPAAEAAGQLVWPRACFSDQFLGWLRADVQVEAHREPAI
jgi:hypothetical protein